MNDIATGPRPSPGKEYVLAAHPDYLHPEIQIDAHVARMTEGDFILRYVVTGDVASIKIPSPVKYASCQDGLWQATCFEVFVGVEKISAYLEFNFAPSTAWAAYAFSEYRVSKGLLPFPAPQFDVEVSHLLEVIVTLDAAETADLPAHEDWQLALSAVIEAKDGTKSYWALAHAPGPPDFHNRDCFIATLPAPTGL